jgi:hypothetical protein
MSGIKLDLLGIVTEFEGECRFWNYYTGIRRDAANTEMVLRSFIHKTCRVRSLIYESEPSYLVLKRSRGADFGFHIRLVAERLICPTD